MKIEFIELTTGFYLVKNKIYNKKFIVLELVFLIPPKNLLNFYTKYCILKWYIKALFNLAFLFVFKEAKFPMYKKFFYWEGKRVFL